MSGRYPRRSLVSRNSRYDRDNYNCAADGYSDQNISGDGMAFSVTVNLRHIRIANRCGHIRLSIADHEILIAHPAYITFGFDTVFSSDRGLGFLPRAQFIHLDLKLLEGQWLLVVLGAICKAGPSKKIALIRKDSVFMPLLLKLRLELSVPRGFVESGFCRPRPATKYPGHKDALRRVLPEVALTNLVQQGLVYR